MVPLLFGVELKKSLGGPSPSQLCLASRGPLAPPPPHTTKKKKKKKKKKKIKKKNKNKKKQ